MWKFKISTGTDAFYLNLKENNYRYTFCKSFWSYQNCSLYICVFSYTMCDAPVNKCASLFILASYEPDMSPCLVDRHHCLWGQGMAQSSVALWWSHYSLTLVFNLWLSYFIHIVYIVSILFLNSRQTWNC